MRVDYPNEQEIQDYMEFRRTQDIVAGEYYEHEKEKWKKLRSEIQQIKKGEDMQEGRALITKGNWPLSSGV